MNPANRAVKNRLHSLTRWPTDLRARHELAYTDYQFVIAMRRCEIDTIELRRIEETAVNLICNTEAR